MLRLSHRTTLILLIILPAVALFALLMGLWHCVRKRRALKCAQVLDEENNRTLRQPAIIATDEDMPERGRLPVKGLPHLK